MFTILSWIAILSYLSYSLTEVVNYKFSVFTTSRVKDVYFDTVTTYHLNNSFDYAINTVYGGPNATDIMANIELYFSFYGWNISSSNTSSTGKLTSTFDNIILMEKCKPGRF
jgi:hypothetical protein